MSHPQTRPSGGQDTAALPARQVSTRPNKIHEFIQRFISERLRNGEQFFAVLAVCGFNDFLICMLPDYRCHEVIPIQPEERKNRKTPAGEECGLERTERLRGCGTRHVVGKQSNVGEPRIGMPGVAAKGPRQPLSEATTNLAFASQVPKDLRSPGSFPVASLHGDCLRSFADAPATKLIARTAFGRFTDARQQTCENAFGLFDRCRCQFWQAGEDRRTPTRAAFRSDGNLGEVRRATGHGTTSSEEFDYGLPRR